MGYLLSLLVGGPPLFPLNPALTEMLKKEQEKERNTNAYFRFL